MTTIVYYFINLLCRPCLFVFNTMLECCFNKHTCFNTKHKRWGAWQH